eukprot:scaffold7738_cov107-Isochrysis_galbana.AAC.6
MPIKPASRDESASAFAAARSCTQRRTATSRSCRRGSQMSPPAMRRANRRGTSRIQSVKSAYKLSASSLASELLHIELAVQHRQLAPKPRHLLPQRKHIGRVPCAGVLRPCHPLPRIL